MRKKQKIKKIATIVGLFIVMFLFCHGLIGCDKEVEREKTEEVLGTIVTIKACTNKGDAPLEAAFDRAEELEMILSANNADSELSQMNQKAYKEEVKVSDELFYVVKKGIYYGEITDGAIDISIGKLIDLWGIGTKAARVPKEAELAPYIGQNGYRKIELKEEKKTIHFLDKNVQVNLGAIAKGYIADEMKKVLVEEYDVQHAMLSLGGNIVVIGDKADGTKWNVGIADPLDTQSVKASFSITDKTVVTSGNYERYFEQNGVRYHHILDANTGYPSDSGLISTSILTNNSIDADALSTATYVLGEKRALQMIEKVEDCEVVLIREDGSTVTTMGVSTYGYKEY